MRAGGFYAGVFRVSARLVCHWLLPNGEQTERGGEGRKGEIERERERERERGGGGRERERGRDSLSPLSLTLPLPLPSLSELLGSEPLTPNTAAVARLDPNI